MTDDGTKRPRRGRSYPPVEHQPQPGQSGSPRGRSRGAKNKQAAAAFADSLTPGDAAAIAEAHRTVTSIDEITRPTIAAIHRARNIAAMKGNRLAAKDADARLQAAEEKAERKKKERFNTALETQLIFEHRHWQFAQAKLANSPFCPHPNDFQFDSANKTVEFHGRLPRPKPANGSLYSMIWLECADGFTPCNGRLRKTNVSQTRITY